MLRVQLEDGNSQGAVLGVNPNGTLNVLPRDLFLEVQKGNLPDYKIVHKFGRNDTVPNGSWEMITLLSRATFFPSAAATVRVKAGGNAADTAAGAGAQEVTVQGIDTSLNEVTEKIATAGASASSATTTSFWRVHRAWVSAVGTYGVANTAAITIEDSGGANDLTMIAVEEGQTQDAVFTIPSGWTGHFMSAFVTVDASKAADIKLCARGNITDTTAPMASIRLKNYWDGVAGILQFSPHTPVGGLVGPHDLWFEAQGGGAGTEVSADFELLLVRNQT